MTDCVTRGPTGQMEDGCGSDWHPDAIVLPGDPRACRRAPGEAYRPASQEATAITAGTVARALRVARPTVAVTVSCATW